MQSQRWIAVTEPRFPWERSALTYLRERLPDQEPFRAWSNFEFIAEDGSINEVDLLVVSLYKIYLVEIKSRPGRVSGDAGTWTWTHEGRHFTEDNPLLLANRKAKKLKSLAVDTRQRDRCKIVRDQTAVTTSAIVKRPHPRGCRTPTPKRSLSDDQRQAITSAAAPFVSQNFTSYRALIHPPYESQLPHLLGGDTYRYLD